MALIVLEKKMMEIGPKTNRGDNNSVDQVETTAAVDQFEYEENSE